MNGFKNLEQAIKEEEEKLKVLVAKKQAAKRIMEAFADAAQGILETGGAGTIAYFSASVRPETEKAKSIIYYSPPAQGQAGNGQFLLRFYVPVGKEKVYSLQAIRIPSSKISEMLNKYIAMPSGSAVVADLIPQPAGSAKTKVAP